MSEKLLCVEGCFGCKLAEGRRRIVNFEAPKKLKRVKVLFVGQGPGRLEDIRGKPFQGPSGKLLRACVDAAGLDPERDIAFGNVVRCRPPGNRDPKKDELAACFQYLSADVEAIDPNIVVLLGNAALEGAHKKLGITKFRGHIFLAERLQRKAIATFHPAAILRDSSKLDVLVADIKKAALNCKDKTIPDGMGDYSVCRTLDDVRKLCDYLKGEKEFTFDLETSSFNYRKGDVLCASFSAVEGTGYVVPVRGQAEQEEYVEQKVTKSGKIKARVKLRWITNANGTVRTTAIWSPSDEKAVVALLQDLLESPGPKKYPVLRAAQNGKFDVHWYRKRLGIEVRNFSFDTMLAYHLVHEEKPHNLEHLRTLLTNMTKYDEGVKEYATKKADSYAQIPNEVLHEYAAADTDCELRVMHRVQKLLIEEYGKVPKPHNWADPAWRREAAKHNAGIWLLENHAMPLSRVYARVEERGVFIDKPRLLELAAEYKADIVSVLSKIEAAVGSHEMAKYELSNVNDLRRLLYGRLVKKWQRYGIQGSAKTGQPSTNTRSLMMLQKVFGTMPDQPGKKNPRFVKIHRQYVDVNVVLDLVLQLRRATKIKSSFLDGVGKHEGTGGLLKHVQDDGRIHCSYNIQGTETGRHSSSNPNNTNIPAEGGIRSLYTVPQKRLGAKRDYVFIEPDYKQIELRVLAYLSGDKDFQKALETEDVHATVGSMLFGVEPEDVTPGMRIKAKTFNFGLNYGRGAPSIAADFSISQEEAQELIDQYLERFPGIGNYHKTQRQLLERGKPAVSVFGRKRRARGIVLLKPYIDRREYRKAWGHLKRQYINMPIQGSASDVVSQSMIALADYDGIYWNQLCEVHYRMMEHYKCGPMELPAVVLLEKYGAHMIGSCHDAIMFEAPKKHAKEVAALIQKTMEDVPRLMLRNERWPDGWDLPTDVSVGPYWGAHKELVGRRGMDAGSSGDAGVTAGWRTLTYKKGSAKGAAGPAVKAKKTA